MHPFYSSSQKFLQSTGSEWIGLISMAMYLIFWGVIIFFAYRFVKKYLLGQSGQKKRDTAIQILRERYARGEIDSEGYRRIRDELKEDKEEESDTEL